MGKAAEVEVIEANATRCGGCDPCSAGSPSLKEKGQVPAGHRGLEARTGTVKQACGKPQVPD